MGATDLTMEIRGKSEGTLNAAFRRKVKAEKKYFGTNPYSGAWNQVEQVRIITYPNAPKRWTTKAKWEAFSYLSTRADKWGDALAIRTNNSFLVLACVGT